MADEQPSGDDKTFQTAAPTATPPKAATAAERPTPRERLRSTVHHPWMIAGAGGLLVAIIAGMVLAAHARRQTEESLMNDIAVTLRSVDTQLDQRLPADALR